MGLNPRLFVRQFYALTFYKNWIILGKHPILNLARCLVIPIAFAVFLAFAQDFFVKPTELGFGSAIPVVPLQNAFDDGNLVWADITNGQGSPGAQQIMNMVTRSFSSSQLSKVIQAPDSDAVTVACPSNYNERSTCYSAVIFNGLPPANDTTTPIYYIIRGDAGLSYVDVKKHTSDYEKHILPLQWAIDSAIIELQTGRTPPTPLEQPFTQESNAEAKEKTRKGFVNAIEQVLVIAFWISFSGVVYQLAGAIAVERASLLSVHLQAMGCLRSARAVSWHLSISLPYVPAWIIAGVLWKTRILTHTDLGLVIGVNLITGFSLASWSLLLATPFSKSPQLAAICTTALAFILALVAMIAGKSTGFACIFTLIFPPSFFVFAMRAMCKREVWLADNGDSIPYPSHSMQVGPPLAIAFITIFLFPLLALWLEHYLFDVKHRNKGESTDVAIDANTVIEVSNLGMVFNRGKKKEVVAINELSLSIPKNGVFVILGSNGSGKSTLHGIISNILSPTSGSITFAGGADRPPRGSIGIVPQKNVLFPELTCFQTVRLWSAVKRPLGVTESNEALEQLLVDCDLRAKMHARSGDMSGGQKRKLQLAIGLVGGSGILMVDEATSGVDPLSRRAIWRALNAVRKTRTIIFTTHFLDEADLLGDDIAILAAPGKLLAHGTPVSLKATYGKGYVLHVELKEGCNEKYQAQLILQRVQECFPVAGLQEISGSNASFDLRTTDPRDVSTLLGAIEREQGDLAIHHYDLHGTSLEEVFLALMEKESANQCSGDDEKGDGKEKGPSDGNLAVLSEAAYTPDDALVLTDGRRINPLRQAWVILLKRLMIAKRSWLPVVLALAALLCGSCIPLIYMKDRHEDCSIDQTINVAVDLYLGDTNGTLLSHLDGDATAYVSPISAVSSLDASDGDFAAVPNGWTIDQLVANEYKNLTVGGLSYDSSSKQALIEYEASAHSLAGAALLNLASNVIANDLRNTTGPRIIAQYSQFPGVFSSGTVDALKWIHFFGLGIAIFPAFATLYTAQERMSGVKAMQLSNGLSPAGLHLGHLLAEVPVVVIGVTVMTIVWGALPNPQFGQLGLVWFTYILFGLAASLFSFIAALFLPTPLIAFAVVTLYNVILFILYVAAYLLTMTYALPTNSAADTHIVHFMMALLGPLPSLLRATLVSVNLFSLRCNGLGSFSSTSPSNILWYGGPITYLLLYIILFLGFLVWSDSGYPLPTGLRFLRKKHHLHPESKMGQGQDVAEERERVENTTTDPLRVLYMSRKFKGSPVKAVDDVSFGVGQETLSLLGPNGAGKTTIFNIIRGGIAADEGDVLINGVSINEDANAARVGLGLCPQSIAIDSQLTVREHLAIYGRLKGLSGASLEQNVGTLLQLTSLSEYSDRLASKLSGGNQRKLSLAIALMGNPSVLLIDEYSTGIDPATKRHLWTTLRGLSHGKAVVITTHSMEEASALSNRVAILSGRLLAIGTVDDLVSRYPMYEIHISCRSPEDLARAQQIICQVFPDSRPADDVATRWEVPLTEGRTLGGLFAALSQQDLPEYAVERLSLESVFLKTIRNNDASIEEPHQAREKFFGIL